MGHLSVELINEHFGTTEIGEEIGYGERGINFNQVDSKDLEDFHENAEIGQCSEIDGQTFYKVTDENRGGDAVAFMIDGNGDIEEF